MIKHEFKTTAPYQKAGTDVTMFPIDEQAVFLYPIIDFHTREGLAQVIGCEDGQGYGDFIVVKETTWSRD